MVFISDEALGKKRAQQEVINKIEKKRQNIMITEKSREKKPNEKMSNQEIIKNINASRRMATANKRQEKITAKDIQESLKIDAVLEIEKEKEIGELLLDGEMSEIKNEVMGVMALPMLHPEKRILFHDKLVKSSTVNSYVNDMFLYRLFNKMNNHVKFGAVYAVKYLQTHAEYDSYVRRCALQQALNNNQSDNPVNNVQK